MISTVTTLCNRSLSTIMMTITNNFWDTFANESNISVRRRSLQMWLSALLRTLAMSTRK